MSKQMPTYMIKQMSHQITNQFFNAFLLFNLATFGINLFWAITQDVDLFAKSLFFSGFNLCILLSDLIYLSVIILNVKILDGFKVCRIKTIEEQNREDLEEHNEELIKKLNKELGESFCKSDSETESEEICEESESHSEEENKNCAKDKSDESSSEDEPELKIKNFATHRVASIGIKQFDDVLSPEEYEKLNFDSL